MPLTAFGTYDVVAFVRRGNENHELCRQSFYFCPFFRFASVLIILGAGVVLIRHFAIRRLGSAWWVTAPLALGVVVFGFFPGFLSPSRTTSNFVGLAQTAGLSLVLWSLCRFKRRRRVVAGLLALALNVVVLLIVERLASDSDGFQLIHFAYTPLMWVLPSLLGLLAVRRVFTRWKLAMGIAIVWLITVGAFTAYTHLRWDIPFEEHAVLWITSMVPLPYLAGFFLLVAFNRWCREGVIRAFGLNRMGSKSDSRGEPLQ